jgi:hypothetical protein
MFTLYTTKLTLSYNINDIYDIISYDFKVKKDVLVCVFFNDFFIFSFFFPFFFSIK